MAFFVWQPGMILTQKCDEDIQKLCLADRPSMAQRPGAVGTCLASILEQQDRSSRRILVDKATTKELSSQCFTLADIAEPPNMKLAFESSLSVAALASGIENTVGVQVRWMIVTERERLGGREQGQRACLECCEMEDMTLSQPLDFQLSTFD